MDAQCGSLKARTAALEKEQLELRNLVKNVVGDPHYICCLLTGEQPAARGAWRGRYGGSKILDRVFMRVQLLNVYAVCVSRLREALENIRTGEHRCGNGVPLCARASVWGPLCARASVYICMCVCVCVCACVCVCTYTCVCVICVHIRVCVSSIFQCASKEVL